MILISGIQVIGIVLAGLIFYEARVLYKVGKFKKRDFGMWTTIALGLVVFSAAPAMMAGFVNLFANVTRGLDALILFALFGAYALVFQVYIRIQETNRQITELVRKVAIELEKKK
ncbi:MAG: DUF2304 family protein [archaeon]